MKICVVGYVLDVITYAKFQNEIFRGYNFTGGRIFHFSYWFWMGLTTVQRYCAACDHVVLDWWTMLTKKTPSLRTTAIPKTSAFSSVYFLVLNFDFEFFYDSDVLFLLITYVLTIFVNVPVLSVHAHVTHRIDITIANKQKIVNAIDSPHRFIMQAKFSSSIVLFCGHIKTKKKFINL